MFDDRPPNFMGCMVGRNGWRLYISKDYVIIWFNETNRRKIVLFLALPRPPACTVPSHVANICVLHL